MRKLADHGQAILCTIHQPSAILMQEFDRLLFLAKGGKTVYFGELGPNMETLIKYFENKGSSKCPKNANPAEWMLEVIGAAPGSHADQDWPEVWNASPERAQLRTELAQMKEELSKKPVPPQTNEYGEFAMPLWSQFLICLQRMFQQYWRSPAYIYSKAITCTIPVSLLSPVVGNALTVFIASVHRLHILERGYQSPGPAESNVRHFHATYYLPQPRPTDDALFRHSACSLRSAGASFKGILVESLHVS